jgi:quercetin dioxygenase-like cupin family protein
LSRLAKTGSIRGDVAGVAARLPDDKTSTRGGLMRLLFAAATLLTAGLLASNASVGAQEIQRKVLLRQDAPPGYQTILTSVEIPVGVSEIRHTHPGMLVVYVLDGVLTLESEGRTRTTYKSGDSFFVESGKVHQGINTGNVAVKIVTTLVAENGKPQSTPAP